MKNKRGEIYTGAETRRGLLFNLPMVIFAAAFILVPVIGTLYSSLSRDVTFMARDFVGIQNYARLFTDSRFWQATFFTFSFVAVSVLVELVLGMIFALVLNEALPARGVFRVAMLIPWAIPIAIAARIWELIYNYEFGLLNFLLMNAGVIDGPVNWLGTPGAAFFSVVVSDVWKTTPFMTVILLAGLATIPADLYRQAMLDGAGMARRFFSITIPMLKPVLVVALLFRSIDAIRIFDMIYVLTGGGPGGSTSSLSVYAYDAFIAGDFGYGSAISLAVFVAAGLLSVPYIKFGKFYEEIG